MKSEKWVVAVDVGATHVSGGLVSTAGEIKSPREIETHDPDDKEPLRDRLFAFVSGIKGRAAKARIKPAGVAVGAPGIVDSDRGVLVVAGNLPELFGLPLGDELSEEVGLPVLVENDVNAQAVGEMVFGVARGVKNFVLFSIGTDLGGGIVIDGKVHRGGHHIAAEFGHLTLDLEGRPCVCGGQGCAREYVSGGGLAERARELLRDGSEVVKKARGRRGRITAEQVWRAAADGDEQAGSLVEEFSKRFGAVVANVMKVLDPEMVVLAGEVCRQEPRLISEVVHWTRHYYFPMPQLPDFRVSELTKETSMLGPAAAFFVEKGFHTGAGRGRG